MNTSKKIALFGLTGVVIATLFFFFAYNNVTFHHTFPDTGSRLAYAVSWGAIPVILLMLPIQVLAIHRFSGTNINPVASNQKQEPLIMRIRERFLQNTLEQYAIFFPLLLALSTSLPLAQMKVIPILVMIFTFARIAFLIGYRLATDDTDSAWKRAFGMAINLVLNWAMLLSWLFLLR